MSSTTNPQATPDNEPDIPAILDRIAQGSRDSSDLAELSDPNRAQFNVLMQCWARLPVDARRFIIREMTRQGNEDPELNFSRLLRRSMHDEDPEVRALSIAGLWEDESDSLLSELCNATETEIEPAVLESIASALDRFGLLAATGELEPEQAALLRASLFHLLRDEHSWMVRRRALESLSYLPGDEEVSEEIIRAAASRNERVQAGAIAAMGRTLDPRWIGTILTELSNEEPDIRFEAARAAGEYEEPRAVPLLLRLLDDEDDEIRLAAIEALGKIGGEDALAALEELQGDVAPDVRETLERALSEARFAHGDEASPL